MACPTTALYVQPTLSRFIYYKILTLVPVSAAIMAMVRHSESPWTPLLYVGLCLTHAGIMSRAKCTHCPYYKVEGSTYRCFIWWGAPKAWAEREGPEHPLVGKYALFGIAVLTFFPVYWLWQEWPLLLIYVLGIGGLLMSILLNECSRCLNFQCGNCGVPEEVRKEYLEGLR
jgi:hypothetical protein